MVSGPVDYLLFVDSHAVGALEAKKLGYPLASAEFRVEGYVGGLPAVPSSGERFHIS